MRRKVWFDLRYDDLEHYCQGLVYLAQTNSLIGTTGTWFQATPQGVAEALTKMRMMAEDKLWEEVARPDGKSLPRPSWAGGLSDLQWPAAGLARMEDDK
jgi:hypothetical protein